MSLFNKHRRQPFQAHYSHGTALAPTRWVSAEEYAQRRAESQLYQCVQSTTLRTPIFPFQRKGPFEMAKAVCSKQEQLYDFPSSFVIKIPNGRLIEGDGVILTEENELLARTSVTHFGKPIAEHRIFQQRCLPNARQMNCTVASIATTDWFLYFHWMCNTLPRFELLRRSGLAYDRLYVPELWYPYQWETLGRLGINLDRLILGSRGLHLQAPQVIAPSLPAGSADCPPWVIDFLRDLLLPEQLPIANRRLYLSRRGARARHIANEKSVISALQRRGFKCVQLESLSVSEQAQLLATAEAVVAPHGAALTNLAFCQPGTRVIEIFHPDWVCDCYWQLTAHLRMPHAVLMTTPIQSKYGKLFRTPRHARRDGMVDMNDLEATLDRLDL